MNELGVGKVASVMGRYYAMDRDNRWDRVELAYRALTDGEGNQNESAPAAIQASYDDGKTDEFVVPCVITENGQPRGRICDGDSVIFFNFRPDRAREITRAFCDDAFQGFARPKNWISSMYALPTMMRQYQISWWLSGKRPSRILLENSWLPMERLRQELPRPKNTPM